jgi:hypothetical protein
MEQAVGTLFVAKSFSTRQPTAIAKSRKQSSIASAKRTSEADGET